MKNLYDAIQKACSARNWSQGVELVREDAIVGHSCDETEVELLVTLPTKTVPYTVVLYLEDLDWECTCGGRERVCFHVAAAAIALWQVRKDGGNALPVSDKSSGRVGYRLRTTKAGIVIDRVIVPASGDPVPLTSTLTALLSGRVAGPSIVPTEADLAVDAILGPRPSDILSISRMTQLMEHLAEVSDFQVEGVAAKADPDPLPPRVVVKNKGTGIGVRIEASLSFTRIVFPGVAMAGDTLRVMSATELTGLRLENLPFETSYPKERLGEFVLEVMPSLAETTELEVNAKNLPQVTTDTLPRIQLELTEKGNALTVLPLLVYGEPARMRIDQGKVFQLTKKETCVRNLKAERELVQRLRDELNLAPGRSVELEGKDALAFRSKLGHWTLSSANAIDERRAVDLMAKVSVDDDHFDVRFEHGGATANPADVLRAFSMGMSLVPMGNGAWGRIPVGWLDAHGDRVLDLLAARGSDGSVPVFAKPDLAKLCDELNIDRPATLSGLASIADDFDKIPPATLPSDLTATLRPYQKLGVDWLTFARTSGFGAVLADDMGLGKTIQALCALAGRTLIVSPTSVLHNWETEIQKFRPEMTFAAYHGPKRALTPNVNVTLTTYTILRNDIDILAKEKWDTIVLDESQAIKNPDSQVARAAYRLGAKFKITMSGTPVENRLDELWSQLHFTNPGLLGSRGEFVDRYANPISNGIQGAAKRLRERIRPFVLRRLKREVAPELPPRTDSVLYVELDEQERIVYDSVRAATQAELVSMLDGGKGVLAALEALLRLRQASCHRSLLPNQSADGSAKLTRLVDALTEAAADGHKSLVFSQWTSFLNLIGPALDAAEIPYVRLDGSTRDRKSVVDAFQSDDGPPVMLISLKAGGTGLNLTAADHVFICDPWWNPAVEDQAADRAHRIGQDKPVMVYRLVAQDTVEERILVLQEKKRALADAALADAGRAASLTRDDLLALLAE